MNAGMLSSGREITVHYLLVPVAKRIAGERKQVRCNGNATVFSHSMLNTGRWRSFVASTVDLGGGR